MFLGRDKRGEETVEIVDMLRDTLEGAPELIAVEDTSARYLAFNRAYQDAFKKIFGVELSIGDNMIEKLSHLPEDQKAVSELFNRTIAGENFTVTHPFGDPRIERRFYELRCFPLHNRQGRVIGSAHIARDVTDLVKAEEELRASQRVIDVSTDCIKSVDAEGRVTGVNPIGSRLMEVDNEEDYVGRMWLDFWSGAARELAAGALTRAFTGHASQFRAPGLTTKGNVRWWDETLTPILDPDGKVDRVMIVARDITEQKNAEDALRENEEEYRGFFESATGGKARACVNSGTFLRVNENFCKLTGYTCDELFRMTIFDLCFPEDCDMQAELFRRNRDRGASEYSIENRYRRKDGETLWVQQTIGFVRDNQGVPQRCYVVVQDVTESKRIREQLQKAVDEAEESRRLLDALMEYVPEGIVITSMPDLRVRMMSRHAREFYPANADMTPNEVAAQERLLRSDGVTPLRHEELPLVRAIRENRIITDEEIIYINERGERRFSHASAGPIYDASGRITGGIVTWHDVSGRKETEDALKAERAFLRQVIDTAPSMVFVKDWDGRFVLANQALANAYGTTIEDVVGKTDADFNPHPEEVEHFLHDDRQVINSCRPKLIPEEKVSFANGEEHWFSTYKIPLIEPDGNCRKLLGVASDITARKRAESTLARFRYALDTADDNIFIIDPQTMRYIDVNQSACRDLGYSREELLGLGPNNVMPQLSDEELHRRFAEIRTDPGKGTLETFHYRSDCTKFEVEVRLQSIQDEGRPLLVAVARDITERKRTETELKQAIEQLAEADHRKDEFLAMLAHELRNPLAPIRNAVQVLRLSMRDDTSLQRQRDIIDRQVSHMARLLDDLLDVSRITRGMINLKKEIINLSDVFARAVESANPLIDTRQHELFVTPPPRDLHLYGDFDRLIQIVGNLLQNAAKYTDPGGKIWLEAERVEGGVEIRVRDTGMGIAPEMLPRIFDVFTQVTRSLDRAQGGLGLGLTLVRNLVEMHGGRIEARSGGLGKGAEFVVRLPAVEWQTGSEARPHEFAPKLERGPRRILIVDDVADTANSLAELLTLIGHEARTAFDGPSVLRVAHEFRPHVILLDIGLPGENGYEVARKIRSDPAFKDVTLVALTGYGQEEDRRLAKEAGFDHLFTKPVELGALQPFLS